MPKPAELISEDDIRVIDDDDANQLEDDDIDVIVDDDYDWEEDEKNSGNSSDDDGDDSDEIDEEEERPRSQDPSLTEAKELLFEARLTRRESDNDRARDKLASLHSKHAEYVEHGKQYKLLEAEAITQSNGNLALEYAGLAESLITQANQVAAIHDELLGRVQTDSAEIESIKAAATSSKEPKRMIDADALEKTIYANTVKFMEKIDYENLPQKLKNVVDGLDKKVFNEGFNPASPKYWKLLEKRFNEKYHNRGNSNQSQNEESEAPYMPKSSPPVSGKTSSSGSTRKEVHLSRERKEALIAAGVWDDATLRTRYIKQYQKWDKENATR